ncbi:MAG: formyltetrahydrofolate deformylase [Ignavibacteriae bacterium]|nr:formyltetrahydrofolate deformylase [Ignavibacteriota bacterium]MCB9205811.1 formyltetrahydrofolate deformylase [Ignavibacteriales bacterium]MCB9219313.1 formyltetrahydrofolate deformylase [Ignavibacteriales bacterium]MCB9260200.1 formyltetrahydrofolate deformylase [Ignavibacteriales bacterium]
MSEQNKKTVILLLSCKDQKGLVFNITNFIYKIGGNIIDLDEHVDPVESMFFVRIAFDLESQLFSENELNAQFENLGKQFNANWEIHLEEKMQKVAIFVSKYDHCLQEIFWRQTLNEFNINIELVISNHEDLNRLCEQNNVLFYSFEITKENKLEAEQQQLDLLKQFKIDTVVLARYMQILSPQFVREYPNKIINIHHSFLPAFIGGNPYKQAFNRGVKIIGATSHYVTNELDEGPIIEQDIVRISHNDSLKDLIRKGRDLERFVLARAILLHSQYRILTYGKKTIVF